MSKGRPRRDGSGRGIRANFGRGGCFNPRSYGRGGRGRGLGWIFGIIIIILLIYIVVNM